MSLNVTCLGKLIAEAMMQIQVWRSVCTCSAQ